MTAPTITALDCGWLRTQERTLIAGGSTDVIELPVPAWLVRHPRGVVVFDAGLHVALADSGEALGRLAKIFEHVDHGVLTLTGVSGHTWKHLASAAGAYWLLRMLRRRRPLAAPPDTPTC